MINRTNRKSFVLQQEIIKIESEEKGYTPDEDIKTHLEIKKRIATMKFDKNSIRMQEVEEDIEYLLQHQQDFTSVQWNEDLKKLKDEKKKLYSLLYGGQEEEYEIVTESTPFHHSKEDLFQDLAIQKANFLQVARKTKENRALLHGLSLIIDNLEKNIKAIYREQEGIEAFLQTKSKALNKIR